MSDYDAYAREIREIGLERFPGEGYNRIVFTNGCFDLVHPGHLEVLAYAKEVAGGRGAVVVGLNSDDSIARLKGPGRPIMDEYARATLLINLRSVDHVVTFDEDTPLELISALRPNVIVKGGDYLQKDVIGNQFALVLLCPLVEGYSTTSIEERICG